MQVQLPAVFRLTIAAASTLFERRNNTVKVLGEMFPYAFYLNLDNGPEERFAAGAEGRKNNAIGRVFHCQIHKHQGQGVFVCFQRRLQDFIIGQRFRFILYPASGERDNKNTA